MSEILKVQKNETFSILFDEEDRELVNRHNWYVVVQELKGGKRFYCVQTKVTVGPNKQKRLRLADLLMHPPEGFIVDHKDHNGCNCKRSNMRVCTRQQNTMNKRATRNGFKGVQSRYGRYQAYIKKDGKRQYLGSYKTPEEAAHAYDVKAKELFGEFATLNYA